MLRRHFLIAVAAMLAARQVSPGAVAAQSAPDNLVGTAHAAGDFQILLAAAGAIGLTETLTGEGPFTVFAPTDAAFTALPQAALKRLLRQEDRERLTAILTYHVVPGDVALAELKEGMKLGTVNGAKLGVSVEAGALRVGGAGIVTPDLIASNGRIHAIDAVLVPPDASL